MKPFDLTRALAGEKVITRDGQKVTEIHFFKTAKTNPVIAITDKGFYISCDTNGRSNVLVREKDNDLFMAEEEKCCCGVCICSNEKEYCCFCDEEIKYHEQKICETCKDYGLSSHYDYTLVKRIAELEKQIKLICRNLEIHNNTLKNINEIVIIIIERIEKLEDKLK